MDPIRGPRKPEGISVHPNAGYEGPPPSWISVHPTAGYEGPPPPSYSTKSPPLTGKTICPPGVDGSPVIPTTPVYTQDSPPPYSALPPHTAYVYAPYPTMAVNGLSPNNVMNGETSRTFVALPRTRHYMASSVLSLFLCLPLGVVALIYSLKTRSAVRRGDLDAAAESSHRALFLNKISRFGILVIITVVTILLFYFIRKQMNNPDSGAG